ncbi:MAG: NADPH-dependent F420 reductase [Anaerolineales bacterium]|nr:NADPH-dependent F420 reductase [Anaerolineales bacterium]
MSDNFAVKPVIAILGGTGKEGSGLALRWAYVGYPVIIGSRQLEKAQMIAGELNKILGKEMITGLENNHAAESAEICVLTVVQEAHQAALKSLSSSLQGKILVDATARVDFRAPAPPTPPSAARMAQNLLGDQVNVVAAFQNVPAHSLKKKLGETLDCDVLLCSDDIPSAQKVIDLANAAGMRALFAGGLDNAIVVEGLTALLISINKYYGIKNASLFISGLEGHPLKS